MEVAGFILREEGDFYYLDVKPCEAMDGDSENRGRDDNISLARRKLHPRHPRHQQLSPVKEASVPVLADSNQSQHSADGNLEKMDNSEEFMVGLDDRDEINESLYYIINFSV